MRKHVVQGQSDENVGGLGTTGRSLAPLSPAEPASGAPTKVAVPNVSASTAVASGPQDNGNFTLMPVLATQKKLMIPLSAIIFLLSVLFLLLSELIG